jgi:hypothetical protein
MIANSFDRLYALVNGREISSEHELREQVVEIEKTIEQSRAQATAAHVAFDLLVDEERFETSDKVADLVMNRQTSKLHARTGRGERCAATAIEIAILAMDEVERAVLRALLARKEANFNPGSAIRQLLVLMSSGDGVRIRDISWPVLSRKRPQVFWVLPRAESFRALTKP